MEEEIDEATGLTTSEKDIIRNTWGLVKQNIPDIGYDLFIRFFTENPTYQQNFKSFKNVPISELRGNKKVLAHATNVLYAITMLVDNLDDTEVLVEMLLKLSKNHFRRGITIEQFRNLKVSLFGLMTDKLGAQLMDDRAVQAWDKTYNVIVGVIQKGYDEASHGDD